MHLVFRNVNDAFRFLVRSIHQGEIPVVHEESRAGPVWRVPEPVLVTYTHPRECVLLNAARDANPFFHLYESLWMLAGRNDVAPLAYYNSRIAEIASDDGETFNGAYGYRWKNAIQPIKINSALCPDVGGETYYHHRFDQLGFLIEHLRKNSHSRRAVLQMWDVGNDLLKVYQTKDVCCNTHAYFSIRREVISGSKDPKESAVWSNYLDMTVCNRSNDMIWGMLGANAVHFSILQQYLAACIGVGVGVYNQMTNNLHVYTNNWKPEFWLESPETPYPDYRVTPLVTSRDQFDKEVCGFVELLYGNIPLGASPNSLWKEPFLREVASPMCRAFWWYKHKQLDSALRAVSATASPDWREAGYRWIKRRERA